MGTFYSNCQVRSDSQEAVVAALTRLLKEPAYVTPAVNGWVGVYPEGRMTDISELAQQLSAAASYPVMALMVHDSDVFCYWLYKNGEPHDEFNSDPDWGTDVDDEHSPPPDVAEKMRVSGSPEALLPYCLSRVTPDQIWGVLHPAEASQAAKELITFSPVSADQYLFADAQAADLTKLLGMDGTLAALSYRYIEGGETRDYILEQFLLIKTDMNVGKAAPQPPKSSPTAEKVNTYFNQRDSLGEPYLVKAARLCLPEAVREFLNGGDDVNSATNEVSFEAGVTALIAAAGASIEHPTRQLETVRLLLDAGADVSARSEAGRTALGEALKMTDPAKHQGKIGRRALEEVLRQAAERSAQVVEMLRAAGATD